MLSAHKLLRRPRPYADESLASYIIRLTENNYYHHPNWIFKMSGLKTRGVYANVFIPEQDDLSLLSLLSETEENVLWSMTFPSVQYKLENTVRVLGNVVTVYHLSKNYVKLCPLCLKFEPYYRLIWNLVAVTACPFHQCLLIDRCPHCFHNIKWFRPSIVKCKCGFDWRESLTIPLPDEQVALSLHIYKLCQVADGDSISNNQGLPPDHPLAHLNFSSFLKILSSLQRFSEIYYVRQYLASQENLAQRLDSHYYLKRNFSLLKNWSEEFPSLMSGYESYLEHRYQGYFQQKIQDVVVLFQHMLNSFSQEDCSFIRRVIEDYFWELLSSLSIKTLQISVRQPTQFHSFSMPLDRHQFLLKEIANELNLKELTLAILFALSQIDIHEGTIFFHMIYFPDVFDLNMSPMALLNQNK